MRRSVLNPTEEIQPSLRGTPRHVSVAAEAFAAALFARARCDVSVQYGANQPEYDLVVVRGERLLKVSVKGSQDGSWGLTQNWLEKADYHGAIGAWLSRHKARTILCFVQLKDVAINQLPRVYLAEPADVAARLGETARGRGDTILYENHVWGVRAKGAGTVETIPASWAFSEERIDQLFEDAYLDVEAANTDGAP